VRRLLGAPGAAVAVLVAPAGYGKTTLLAEWAERDPRPFAWLTLDDGDADVARLSDALGERLAEADPGRSRPVVVVVDDAHVLRRRRSLAAVTALADHLPPGSLLALASRAEPALPLARLRAQGALIELRARDLAMTEREAATLLRRAGVSLEPAEVATLMTRTEGWPAGLYLAALSLREQDDLGAAVARFAGDDRIVSDYLRDELLAPLDPADLAFLTRVSPLDELSGPLCDAVLERTGSGRVLRDLSRSSLLLASLDRSEERFRAHPLLADALRADLRRGEPERERELHRRASAWHERQADLDHAIEHAAAAGDAARAGALLWSVAPGHESNGRHATVGACLGRFGEAQIAAHPELALTAALHHVTRGDRDEAERWWRIAERTGSDAPGLRAGMAMIRALIAPDGVGPMGEDAARAYALDAEDGPWRAVACLFQGAAHYLTGQRERARTALDEGARRSARRSPGVHALCLAQLALIALEQADWEQGAALADRAEERIASAGRVEAPAAALVHAAAAFARAHRGRVDEARENVGEARRMMDATDCAPWYAAQVRIALARAELRLSDAAEARALLTEASRALRRTPDAIVLQAWVDDAWARADSFAAAAVAGPSRLTIAELRVLRFLPSHLSFREIAARLHVSANTVKTQAHAVYRKLDTSSRSGAVTRARDVGLIEG
jgi:LuxR family maltose regulon positive regulatory protein